MESRSCNRRDSVATAAWISAGEKYVFEFVSWNKQECQGDKFLASSGVLLALLCTALPRTLNTGTDTCKANVQHCNTP